MANTSYNGNSWYIAPCKLPTDHSDKPTGTWAPCVCTGKGDKANWDPASAQVNKQGGITCVVVKRHNTYPLIFPNRNPIVCRCKSGTVNSRRLVPNIGQGCYNVVRWGPCFCFCLYKLLYGKCWGRCTHLQRILNFLVVGQK